MKARFILACSAAGIAVSAFFGPTAAADDFSASIGFVQDLVEPGYGVDITGTCDDPKFTTSPVISQVLEPVEITGHDDGHGGRVLSARTTVKPDATPGVWPVSFTCGTKSVTGSLRVVAEEEQSVLPAISIDPKKGVAGTRVAMRVICEKLEPVTSAALNIGSVTELRGGGESRPYFEVTGKVKNVRPGVYRVSTACHGKPISTSFTVLPSAKTPHPAQVAVKPKRAPETGDA